MSETEKSNILITLIIAHLVSTEEKNTPKKKIIPVQKIHTHSYTPPNSPRRYSSAYNQKIHKHN